VASTDRLRRLEVFAGPEHRPFRLEGGRGFALLVHGFLGTPADLRALGEALHREGWTVEAPLLPGFGPDLETLPRRRWREWPAFLGRVLEREAGRRPRVLVGHSMGGALALVLAEAHPVDGLVLMAPFWSVGGWRMALAWPFLRLLHRRWRPFARADFQDPRLREALRQVAPGADPDDPDLQSALRALTVPFRLFDELRDLGRHAGRSAPRVRCPALVLQGTEDPLVRRGWTRRLAVRLGGPVAYREVPAQHDLPLPACPAYPEVWGEVRAFLTRLAPGAP